MLGKTNPDFYGGLTNTLRYKDFSLEFLFYFRRKPMQSGYFWRFYDSIGGSGNITKELADQYWKGPGDTSATLPGLTTSRNSDIGYSYFYYLSYSDKAYSTGSYIKLQNLKLAYNLEDCHTLRNRIPTVVCSGSKPVYHHQLRRLRSGNGRQLHATTPSD